MKVNAQQYADALLMASKNLSESQLAVLCQRFVEVLANDGHLSWWPAIETAFVAAWEQANGLAAVELYSPRSLSNEELESLTKTFEAKLNRQISWKIIFDKNLIAGFKIKYHDRVWDLSLLEGLNQLQLSIES